MIRAMHFIKYLEGIHASPGSPPGPRLAWTSHSIQIDTGRYGIVVQTVIKSGEKAGTKVVIKKILSPFENEAYSTLLVREIQILRSLKHENFPKIIEVYTPNGGPEDFDNVRISFPSKE
uniref:Serine-threonine/tyrosine-protein kinase catalytic domain-containing protein n=1 Tax=Acrobeloides nanus TaxID=290746 RepID=A0A914D4I8_9BILA